MMAASLDSQGRRRGVAKAWVFDLDNTLYPRTVGLFTQIDRLMTAFIMVEAKVARNEADRLRRAYWEDYGATLTGMMARHGTDPARFLEACHRLDLSSLAPNPRLYRVINALPGLRLIHTNGPRAHASRVLAALGLAPLFSEIVAIEDMGYCGKPRREAFEKMLNRTGITPDGAVMVEDSAANLVEPHRLGMATVLVDCAAGSVPSAPDAEHIHHRTLDLAAFLESYVQRSERDCD